MTLGMNTISGIKKSVDIILKKKIQLALLHYTNIYPTPEKYIRLNCIESSKKISKLYHRTFRSFKNNFPCYCINQFRCRIIEKHFVIDKKKVRPDVSSSMFYNELTELIIASKIVFNSKGYGKKAVSHEKSTANFAFASVVSIKKIFKGQKLSEKNIDLKRPGNGFYGVKDYKKLLGKKVKRDIKKNVQIKKKIFKYEKKKNIISYRETC